MTAAARVLAAAAFLTATALDAQPTRTLSWEWFLAATPAEIGRVLKPQALDSADALEAIVLREHRVLEARFGFRVPVALSMSLPGSASHPVEGILMSAPQLRTLRDSLPDARFADVARLLLAHEWGHMVQFRAYAGDSALLLPANRRIVECQADMIAGSAIGPLAADPADGSDTFKTITHRYAALVFNIGTPDWDLAWLHPSPVQRQLCITTGGIAGLHWNLLERHRATGDTSLWRQINRNRVIDRRLFGPGDQLIPWMRREAGAIISGVPTTWDLNYGFTDYVGEVRRIAQAVQFGPDSIMANRAALVMSGTWSCSLDDTPSALQVRCTWGDFPSGVVALSSYNAFKALVRPVMFELQWQETPEFTAGTFRSQSFVRTDRRTSLLVTVVEHTGVITATFAYMR